MADVQMIGAPENDSERKAVQYLAKYLPASYSIFSNLELPNASGLPYEYDIIVVGEYAVYVVEVKGYRGRITGNASEWQLDSGRIIKSPVPLLNKKAKIVGTKLSRQHALRQVFVHSLLILTDDKVSVSINDPQASRVLHLDAAVDYILDPKNLPVAAHSIVHVKDKISHDIVGHFKPLHRRNDVGDYQVIDTIGKNQLYTTLLAEHRLIRTNKRFTLKVYSFNIYASPEARKKHEEWILRDANALMRLAGHPNIVQVYPPFPWEDNKFVLPVEWVDGFALRGLLDAGASLSFARKIAIVRQVCEGLRYAHAHGVIHRDVRPDNIIVPDDGPVKLVNFDCARVEGEDMQTIRTRLERYLDQRYVAPEVWVDAGNASPASDIFATGIVLFELLTGQTPYQHIRELVKVKGLPNLSTQIDTTSSADVDEIVRRMCAIEPQKRYASLDEVIEDLTIIG